MKVSIKLTAEQYKGTITCIENIINCIEIKDMTDYCYWEELVRLKNNMLMAVPFIDKKKTLSISGISIVVLYELLNEIYDSLLPYELAIADIILRAINLKYTTVSGRIKNFLSQDSEPFKQIQ